MIGVKGFRFCEFDVFFYFWFYDGRFYVSILAILV